MGNDVKFLPTFEKIDVSCSLEITEKNKDLCLEAYKVFRSYIHWGIDDIKIGKRFNLTYDFNVHYLGGINERLDMLVRLLDVADKKKINFECLNKARMESYLIFRLCNRLLKLVK